MPHGIPVPLHIPSPAEASNSRSSAIRDVATNAVRRVSAEFVEILGVLAEFVVTLGVFVAEARGRVGLGLCRLSVQDYSYPSLVIRVPSFDFIRIG
jgi:hypothetical protein